MGGLSTAPSPIYVELGVLNAEIDRLSKTIDLLADRMNPVLQNVPSEVGAREKEGPTAPLLAEEIAANRRGVTQAADRLRHLFERIAL